MEFKRIYIPLIRWWWLIALATALAAVASFIATLSQPPVYLAQATLMIGRVINDPNPASNEFYLSQMLASNYAEIANREPVRDDTMQALGMNWLPQYRVSAEPNSQFIEIMVTDTNPQRAQIVANELAHQLVLRSPTSGGLENQARREFIDEQLMNLEVQIKTTNDDILKRQEELGNLTSARQIVDAQNQITALQGKLTTLQSNYANLLSNSSSGAINSLTIVQNASVPTKPIGPNKLMTVLLSALVGFALSTGAAFLMDYLDDTIRYEEEVTRLTGFPILGQINQMSDTSNESIFVSENPRHPYVEAFRSLRTSMEFAGVDKPLRTILISSAETQNGKSFVAANLAVVIAQTEKKVVLIDADLRKPSLHKYFNLSNSYGLSDLFRNRLSIQDAQMEWEYKNLRIVTAGNPPPNPAELLGSKKMGQILEEIQEDADVVIIDGPPFIVTDAVILAAKVDGVLLVIRPNYTHRQAVKAMIDQIRRSTANVIGVVLNGMPSFGSSYYGSRRYPSDYFSKDDNLNFDGEKEITKELKPVGRGNTALTYAQKLTNGMKQNLKRGDRYSGVEKTVKNE